MMRRIDDGILAQGFSAAGHFFIHMFTVFYAVIVLGLVKDWPVPYDEAITYWALGSFMVGLGALPAGWLADHWSARGMMAVFFIGIGLSSILCGLVSDATGLILGMTSIGLFAAIYHPVGIPWTIATAKASKGKALGFNGIFGNGGVAGAGLIAGSLTDFAGWRAAFIVPGVLAVLTGLAFIVMIRKGRIPDGRAKKTVTGGAEGRALWIGFAILTFTVFLSGLIYQATQNSLPKMFEDRLPAWLGGGEAQIGTLVSLVYGVAALMQYAGGHIADRYPLKSVYRVTFALQIPLLILMAVVFDLPLLAVALFSVVAGTGALPAENLLIAKFSPSRHQSLSFGLKFVVSFGCAPLAIYMVGQAHRLTGDFAPVYYLLAGCAVIVLAAVSFLPDTAKNTAPSVRPMPTPRAAE